MALACRTLVGAELVQLGENGPVSGNGFRHRAVFDLRGSERCSDVRRNQIFYDGFVRFDRGLLDLFADAADLVQFRFSVGGLTAPMVNGRQPGVESGRLPTTPGGRHE